MCFAVNFRLHIWPCCAVFTDLWDCLLLEAGAPACAQRSIDAEFGLERHFLFHYCGRSLPLRLNLFVLKTQVAELKMELKLRGLPVSGTKMDLIERLKPYQDLNNNSVSTTNAATASPFSNGSSNPGEVAAIFPVAALNKPAASSVPSLFPEASVGTGSKPAHMECLSSSLPISPSPSEQSSLSTDDTSMGDALTDIITMMSPPQYTGASPLRAAAHEDGHAGVSHMELEAAEKDRKLQEKEKQIEELKRKLEREQKLVEVLKMQLEVEKRGQGQQPPQATCANPAPALGQKHTSSAVKEEGPLADCSDARQSVSEASCSLGQSMSAEIQNLVAKKAVVIKQEIPLAKGEPQTVMSPFYVSAQRAPQTAVVAQPQALLTAQGTAQLLLPLSLQGPNPAVHLPVGSIQVQVWQVSSTLMV